MWKKITAVFFLLFVVGAVWGMVHEWRQPSFQNQDIAEPLPQEPRQPMGDPPTPPPSKSPKTVTVYFGDGEAMYLMPEQRYIYAGEDEWAREVIAELIRGPQDNEHVKTVPPNAKLRDLWIEDGIAYVDFSREFQSEHWGGSAGDTFTLFSIVNSLTELPNIEAVYFLIEGETEDAILGHMDTTRPMGRRDDLIKR